ncbi:MAG TPA: hypothetical protein VER03_10650 [Bryobacteraceae bacterium]|nr:hypothetical protein [Bryobacteraceae bacterium]
MSQLLVVAWQFALENPSSMARVCVNTQLRAAALRTQDAVTLALGAPLPANLDSPAPPDLVNPRRSQQAAVAAGVLQAFSVWCRDLPASYGGGRPIGDGYYLFRKPARPGDTGSLVREEEYVGGGKVGQFAKTFRLCRATEDLPIQVAELPERLDAGLRSRQTLRVGLYPLGEAASPVEQVLAPSEGADGVFRSIQPPAIEEELQIAVSHMLAADVHIAMFPELSVDLPALQRVLRAMGNGDSPRLIIAGHSDVLPGDHLVRNARNRVTLLDGVGTVLAYSDKRIPMRLTAHDSAKLGLGGDGDWTESLLPAERVSVVETRLGRAVLPICVDYLDSSMSKLVQGTWANLIFCPSMSPSIDRWRSRAPEYGTLTGATTFVVNRRSTAVKTPTGQSDAAQLGFGWRPIKPAKGLKPIGSTNDGHTVNCQGDGECFVLQWRGFDITNLPTLEWGVSN